MPKGWLKESLKRPIHGGQTFVVLGVTSVGDLRYFKVLDTFSFSPHHVEADSPLLLSPIDVLNHDYVIVVPEAKARLKGWLK